MSQMTDADYACPDCSDTFTTPQGLGLHRSQRHGYVAPGSDDKTICPDCGTTVKAKYLVTHRRKLHGVSTRGFQGDVVIENGSDAAYEDEEPDPLAVLRRETAVLLEVVGALQKLSRESQHRVMMQIESHLQVFGRKR